MGVDEDIQNIYYSIYNINITLANIDQSLAGALNGMNFGLDVFDHHVNMVVQTVNDAQNNIVSTTNLFPHQWLYLTILLFVVVLLMGLVGYLIFYIVKHVLNRQQRIDDYRMWYLKNVMKKKFKNEDSVYYDDGEEAEEEENYRVNEDVPRRHKDTPPPTYNEIESQRLPQQPRRNQEWSTLI